MQRRRALLPLLLAASPSVALAHHGQDFLLLESPGVPHPGDAYLLANANAALDGDAGQQAGFEPAILVGLAPRVSFELHAHTEKLSGEDWSYEATAPALHVLLTDPARHEGLKIGLGLEYEIAREAEAADNTELRLSFEGGDPVNLWGANLIASHEQGGDYDFGAAFGYRHALRPGLSLGVEGESSFRRAAGAELLAGAYYEHGQRWALKLGLGGVREEDGDTSPMARIGLVLRLLD